MYREIHVYIIYIYIYMLVARQPPHVSGTVAHWRWSAPGLLLLRLLFPGMLLGGGLVWGGFVIAYCLDFFALWQLQQEFSAD